MPTKQKPPDGLRLPFGALKAGSKEVKKSEEGTPSRGMGELAKAKAPRLGVDLVCVRDSWLEVNFGARIPQTSNDSKQPFQRIIPAQPKSPMSAPGFLLFRN